MLSLFKKPNKSKGAGPDGISSQLIIDCADLIAPHIISITFNSSLAIMVYFLMTGSLQGLLLYSSKRQKKRHRQLLSNISYLYNWQSI